jgi:hypothetical protein
MAYLQVVKHAFLISFLLTATCLRAMVDKGPRWESPDQTPRISRCYPNPDSSQIQFDIRKPSGTVLRLCVYNFLGRKVADVSRVGPSLRLDLAGFTRGIYIFQLIDAQGRVMESGKFQVER